MKINKLICKDSFTIGDVLRAIDENSKGTAFIVDDKECLCGVITDGDIRRALLSGKGLNNSITEIVKKDFAFAKITDEKEDMIKKFTYRVKILPIVDKNMRVVDFTEFRDDTRISLASPQLNGNEYKYLMEAFLSTWISSNGKYITQFEESFSKFCGVKYGVATSNGTTALHLTLVVLGIGQGDEVIVPNLTFAATINSVIYTGATPVIVDIEADSWCIDPECVEKAITPKTKAIIPVHLYGQPCNMIELCRIAKEHNLMIIEDCAEAHGAEYDGKRVGSFGIISCFSFFGNKVITTGEGGMCITNDKGLYEKLRVYRDHGMSKEKKYLHEVIGFNYRMTNMQAAIGAAQVEHINDILQWREQLEATYESVFKQDKRIVLQRSDIPHRKKIAWLISILVKEELRDVVINTLKDNGIDVRAFFVPLNQMDLYKKYAGACPVSEQLSRQGINLPTTYEMNKEKVEKIYKLIRGVLDNA